MVVVKEMVTDLILKMTVSTDVSVTHQVWR